MNKAQAQNTLDKLKVTIANKIVEHKNELGKHNKGIVEGALVALRPPITAGAGYPLRK